MNENSLNSRRVKCKHSINTYCEHKPSKGLLTQFYTHLRKTKLLDLFMT